MCTDTLMNAHTAHTPCTHMYALTPCTKKCIQTGLMCTYIYEYICTCSPCIDLQGFKHMYSPGSYTQHKHTTLAQVCAGQLIRTCFGSVSTLGLLYLLPCAWPRMSSLPSVSSGCRSLTLLGEFCLCSGRQQGCAAAGAPILWG